MQTGFLIETTGRSSWNEVKNDLSDPMNYLFTILEDVPLKIPDFNDFSKKGLIRSIEFFLLNPEYFKTNVNNFS